MAGNVIAGPDMGVPGGDFGGIVRGVDLERFGGWKVDSVAQLGGGALLDLVSRVAHPGGGSSIVAERVFAVPGDERDTVHVAPVLGVEGEIQVGDPLRNVPGAEAGIQPHDRAVHLPKAHRVETEADAVEAARAAVESALQAHVPV